MDEKCLCIVSHSHWDREWYLSHAKHNYRLIKLFDTLIETLEKDPHFKSFHLDGQVILIEDYLRTRPEMEERLRKLIAEGRIKIGPFYILQDEFLVSGEANIRNVLVGLRVCKKYGTPSMTGYFPDAFGNISQIPQILKGFNIDNAFFGRGIIPIAYANEIKGKSDEGYSEIMWRGADGSEIIGVQFVNWYHNAYQIPHDTESAITELNKVIASTSEVARTPFLLGMNGCDHQPVQTDLGDILERTKGRVRAKVIHTTLEDYIDKIRPYKDKFYHFTGEINGQNGDGYITLINTASSRIYLKQLNYQCQHILENILEPLSCMLEKAGGTYDKDMIDGCYKYLLHNHPHDSICGCSVDSVHAKMVTRFNDVYDTATSLTADVLKNLATKIDTCTGADKNILVFNTQSHTVSGVVEGELIYRDSTPPPALQITNGDTPIPASFSYATGMRFDLPDDKFREVYECVTVHFSMLAQNIPAMGFTVFQVHAGNPATSDLVLNNNGVTNSKITLTFQANGTFTLSDKASGLTQSNLHYFEETGDIGNEYEFKQHGQVFTTLNANAKIEQIAYLPEKVEYKISVDLMTQDNTSITITSIVLVEAYSDIVKIKTSFQNTVKNHRIRALFPSSVDTQSVYAFGQYDIVKRKIDNGARWKNPNNPQRIEGLVYLFDNSNQGNGLTIGTRGLCEYEVLKLQKDDSKIQTPHNNTPNTLAITLVRGIGELGDWFYFPTYDSQCLEEIHSEYSLALFHTKSKNITLQNMLDYVKPCLSCIATDQHHGAIQANSLNQTHLLLELESDNVLYMGAFKKAENGNGFVARIANLEDTTATARANIPSTEINMAETSIGSTPTTNLVFSPKHIKTIKILENIR